MKGAAYLFQSLSQVQSPASQLQAYFQTGYCQQCWHQNLQEQKEQLVSLTLFKMKLKTCLNQSASQAKRQEKSNFTAIPTA